MKQCQPLDNRKRQRQHAIKEAWQCTRYLLDIATTSPSFPGAHTFLGGYTSTDGWMWHNDVATPSPHKATKRRCTKHKNRSASTKAGQAVDAAITEWVSSYPAPPTCVANQAAYAAISLLVSNGFVPMATQLAVANTSLQCAPILDLIGHFPPTSKGAACRLSVVEIKVGGSSFSIAPVGDNTHMHAPFGGIRDSWRNRCMAQLALQVLCVKCACKHIQIEAPMSVDGYLLRVRYGTGTAPTLVKMSPHVYAAMEAASHTDSKRHISATPTNKMGRV